MRNVRDNTNFPDYLYSKLFKPCNFNCIFVFSSNSTDHYCCLDACNALLGYSFTRYLQIHI